MCSFFFSKKKSYTLHKLELNYIFGKGNNLFSIMLFLIEAYLDLDVKDLRPVPGPFAKLFPGPLPLLSVYLETSFSDENTH